MRPLVFVRALKVERKKIRLAWRVDDATTADRRFPLIEVTNEISNGIQLS